ncbi:MAG TPA: lipoyl(octanoyl) transferase [Anaerolineales bacterium]|nr:lipoyl(octanoyl) transferase [Anaerolineales bacterium]
MLCEVVDLGLIEYDAAWALQDSYAAEIAQGVRAPTLLLLEHPHVYTFGARGDAANLLWDQAQLKDRRVAVRWVDRGGDVTYHGPGQLVGYPLFPLGKVSSLAPAPGAQVTDIVQVPRADYVGHIRKLERSLIGALARLGVAAAQLPRLTGVWIQPHLFSRCPPCRPEDRQKPAKIAAIGVKVDSHGISRHGFALNVDPDMSYWDGIIPCGLAGHPLVSLADLLGSSPSMGEVKRAVTHSFAEVFGLKIASVSQSPSAT